MLPPRLDIALHEVDTAAEALRHDLLEPIAAAMFASHDLQPGAVKNGMAEKIGVAVCDPEAARRSFGLSYRKYDPDRKRFNPEAHDIETASVRLGCRRG